MNKPNILYVKNIEVYPIKPKSPKQYMELIGIEDYEALRKERDTLKLEKEYNYEGIHMHFKSRIEDLHEERDDYREALERIATYGQGIDELGDAVALSNTVRSKYLNRS